VRTELGQGIPPDSVKRALDEVFARPAYEWATQPQFGQWARDRWLGLREWLESFERTNPLMFKLFLAALVLLLVALLVHIGYVLWQILRSRPGQSVAVPAALASATLNAAGHLARADELARAGAWAEALGHRFLALVLELDHRRAVRFHPSKTPAEYIGEARLEPAGRDALTDLVGRLYRHVFGAAPCDVSMYRAFGDTAQAVVRSVRAQ
jgi:uncharacterized protein DUF4129